MMAKDTDNQLIGQYKSTGDLRILTILYKRYDQKLYRTCMKYLKNTLDSEDACVEIFLLIKDQLLRYDIKNFDAWLYITCKNHCIKKLKKRAKNWSAEQFIFDFDVNYGDSDTLIEERLQNLPSAIDQLSDTQRYCIVLFYFHDKSYKEISVEKGYSLNQVRSYIQHGKIKLKKILTTHV